MTRYRLPEVLGGGEVDAEETWGGCAGGRPEYRIEGITVTMPAGTPMEPVDTTPPEPEPGVYFIGNDGEAWQHFADRADEQRWCVVGYSPILTWRQVWAKVGGPGITPRRLVPEPAPVDMPYALYDVTVEARENGVWLAVDEEGTYCSPEAAESHGWALISAARAAREATS